MRVMFDYEIVHYVVECHEKDKINNFEYFTDTEEKAKAFVEKNKRRWDWWRVLKVSVAVAE